MTPRLRLLCGRLPVTQRLLQTVQDLVAVGMPLDDALAHGQVSLHLRFIFLVRFVDRLGPKVIFAVEAADGERDQMVKLPGRTGAARGDTVGSADFALLGAWNVAHALGITRRAGSLGITGWVNCARSELRVSAWAFRECYGRKDAQAKDKNKGVQGAPLLLDVTWKPSWKRLHPHRQEKG